MQISTISNYNSQPLFKAKFIDTPAIREVAKWAIENGKYNKLTGIMQPIDLSSCTASVLTT